MTMQTFSDGSTDGHSTSKYICHITPHHTAPHHTKPRKLWCPDQWEKTNSKTPDSYSTESVRELHSLVRVSKFAVCGVVWRGVEWPNVFIHWTDLSYENSTYYYLEILEWEQHLYPIINLVCIPSPANWNWRFRNVWLW